MTSVLNVSFDSNIALGLPSLPPSPLPPVGRSVYILSHSPGNAETNFPSCGCETPFQTQESGYSDHLTKNNVIMHKKWTFIF